MKIFPAVDVFGGKAVRLYHGDYEKMTVYGDPDRFAREFAREGAEYLHVVDLEGAKSGETPNCEVIAGVIKVFGRFTEVGGGVRSLDVCEKYFSRGAGRVVIGTAALNGGFIAEAVKEYGDRIAVGLDLRGGRAAVNGWTEDSGAEASKLIPMFAEAGVKTVICTDISRDGAMCGANIALYSGIVRPRGMELIASGGVSSVSDVYALKKAGADGAIIGKAYYSGALSIKQALEAAK